MGRVCSVVLLWVGISIAFRRGDLVSMTKRSKLDGEQTAWTEVIGDYSPRFKIDKTVELGGVLLSQYSSEKTFKMSFGFADGTVQSSWISVADASGEHLMFVTFTFKHSGDDIVGLSFEADYSTGKEHNGFREHDGIVRVHYKWEHVPGENVQGALSFLFVAGFLLTFVLMGLLIVEISSNAGRRSNAGVRSRRTRWSDVLPLLSGFPFNLPYLLKFAARQFDDGLSND